MRWVHAALVTVGVVGCAASHVPIPDSCEARTDCPAGMICAPIGSPMRRCVRPCGREALCPDGSACIDVGIEIGIDIRACWPGGDIPEGAECTRPWMCERGLACFDDRGAEVIVQRCEPPCDSSEECRAGEGCIAGHICGASCGRDDPSTCPGGTICRGDLCEWAAHAADCLPYDGVPDCPIGQICQLLGGDTMVCRAPSGLDGGAP